MKRFDWMKAVCLLAAMLLLCTAAGAESYSAGTMRLLRFQGEVGITDAAGSERFVMENTRFSSGETMRTGSGSNASVSLDASKIVSLDEATIVDFTQAGSALTLTLKKGTIFLDVSEKLDDNETFEIETSNMTIGIRGTIIYVTEHPELTVLGVLEGTAEATVKDGSGKQIRVPAGQVLILPGTDQTRDLTPGDPGAFVWQQVMAEPALLERVRNACPQLQITDKWAEEPYPHVHIPGKVLRFNYVAATCGHRGSYTEAVRCELCDQVLRREEKTVSALSHRWVSTSRTFWEETPAATLWGHYEECSVCGATRKITEGTDPH